MKGLFSILFTLFTGMSLLAQSGNIVEPVAFNGCITTLEGKGVKAKIIVQSDGRYSLSDGKGRFGLTNVKGDDRLLFVIKRDTLELAVEGRRSLRVVLTADNKIESIESDSSLEELGMRYVRRREIIDLNSGISGDRLRATGCYNFIEALQVCYPSIRVINGELCLRLPTSMNNSSAALVLCDGAEMRADAINLTDVKLVKILKNSNIYGFRGVNGVILVTTNSGAELR